MVYYGTGHEEELHLLKGLVVASGAALFADGGDTKVPIEELLQIGVGATTKGGHPYAIQNYLLKLPFKPVDDVVVLVDNILSPGLIHKYSPQLHLKYGPLQGTGECVGSGRMVIQLREKHIKNLGCDTTIESIVNILSLLLVLKVFGKSKVGVDQAHHSSLMVMLKRASSLSAISTANSL